MIELGLFTDGYCKITLIEFLGRDRFGKFRDIVANAGGQYVASQNCNRIAIEGVPQIVDGFEQAGLDTEQAPIFIGFDPGVGGAICVLNERGELLHASKLPKGDDTEVRDAAKRIVQLMADRGGREGLGAIERQFVKPAGNGPAAMAREVRASKAMRWFGFLEGLCYSAGIELVEVASQTWQATSGVTRILKAEPGWKDLDQQLRRRLRKAKVAELARCRWPMLPCKLVKDYDVADAAWIANEALKVWNDRKLVDAQHELPY